MSNRHLAHIIPQPLVGSDAGTSASKRLLAAVTVANGPPTAATDGASTTWYQKVNVYASCAGAGASYSAQVWLYFKTPALWVLSSDYGAHNVTTANTAGATTATADTKHLDTAGAERIYVEVSNFVGAACAATVWVDGLTTNA